MVKPITYNILNSLCKNVQKTGIKSVYLIDRPEISLEQENFVVIDLPANIERGVKGNTDFILNTEGVFYLGVRSKSNGTPNIDKQTQLIQKLLDLFPIIDKYIVATNPTILFKGRDKSDFQITTITYNIRTKINSFKF